MCDICRQHPCHPRCPNAEEPKVKEICSICHEGIYIGDKYIENDKNEYAHFDCIDYGKEMAEFLGYEIKEMDQDY